MLPLAGKPMIQHIINYLKEHGFYELFITTNYKRGRLIDLLGDGSRFDLKLEYPEEKKPLGTAGSVKNVAKHIDDTFVVIQGDNVTDLHLKAALEFHREKNGLATIVLISVDDPSAFGIAELDENSRITRFLEKPSLGECFSNLANTGIYVFEPEVLKYIPEGRSYDFSKELFPELLRVQEQMYGYQVACSWFDVGTLENYLRANTWILQRLEGKHISDTAEIRGDIQGPVIVGNNTMISEGAKIKGPTMIGGSCEIHENSLVDQYCVLENNVTVEAGSQIVRSIIYENSRFGNNTRLLDCVIGENCRFGSDIRVGRFAAVGAKCRISDYTEVKRGALIWPGMKIRQKSVIDDVVK
jgi:mannose-1-phosphate guanylyltransferase/phosphomannomutase